MWTVSEVSDTENVSAFRISFKPILFQRIRSHYAGVPVRVLGLPLSSVIVLIVIPLVIIAYQYYLCWQIKTGRRE
jgi:hypothetical protein